MEAENRSRWVRSGAVCAGVGRIMVSLLIRRGRLRVVLVCESVVAVILVALWESVNAHKNKSPREKTSR